MSDLDPAVRAELWRFDKYLQRRGIDGRKIIAAEFEKYWDQYLRDKQQMAQQQEENNDEWWFSSGAVWIMEVLMGSGASVAATKSNEAKHFDQDKITTKDNNRMGDKLSSKLV